LIGVGAFSVLAPYGCGGGEAGTREPAAGGTRAVEHALGKTEVPEDPERVVSVYTGPDLAHLLALGEKPVAAAALYASGPPFDPSLPEGSTEGVEPLRFPGGEVDLEKVAALRPDLIVGQDYAIEGVYDELSQIAATVATPWTDGAWREDFLFVGGVLGKRARAEELLAGLDADVRAAGERLGGQRTTVSMATVQPDGVWIYNENAFAGEILGEVGIPVVSGLEEDDFGEEHRASVSLERLPAANGDALFMLQDPRFFGEEEYEEARSQPLWDSIPAVKGGRVYTVNAMTWYIGSVYAARRVLEDLHKYLLDGGRNQ
jgi:iron complex transport system substrate-binding protein